MLSDSEFEQCAVSVKRADSSRHSQMQQQQPRYDDALPRGQQQPPQLVMHLQQIRIVYWAFFSIPFIPYDVVGHRHSTGDG
jgi:hypothetical protein